jgi:hypothetical protein
MAKLSGTFRTSQLLLTGFYFHPAAILVDATTFKFLNLVVQLAITTCFGMQSDFATPSQTTKWQSKEYMPLMRIHIIVWTIGRTLVGNHWTTRMNNPVPGL